MAGNSEYEGHINRIIFFNPNMAVPYYILTSYAYYVEDDPIVSDSYYDELAKYILLNWEDITHFHKHYLNEDALKAGSYLGDYPPITETALKSLKNELHPRSNRKKRRTNNRTGSKS